MAKVCLVSFHISTGYYPSFNHGLAYLIGSLKAAGHDVAFRQLLSEGDLDGAKGRLEGGSPDILGLSFTTNQKKYVRPFLENAGPDRELVVAGGAHATLAGDGIFEDIPGIDGVCIGEGEAPLTELCRRLDDDEDVFSVPSFIFKTGGGIVRNPMSPLRELDSLALPDYTLFEHEKVIGDSGDCFPMLVSRGCPHNCSYCCNHAFREKYPDRGKYVRFPSVSRAIGIIRSNLSSYPKAEKIVFNDDVLVLNKRWLKDFCAAYRREIGLPFRCNARVESMTDDAAASLKDAGCLSVAFGIESGNEWLRSHVLGRKHSNETVRRAFSIVKRHGLKTFAYNIVGLPFETKGMAQETLDLNLSVRPDFGKCFYYYPFPGTASHRLCERYDLLPGDLEAPSGFFDAPTIKDTFMARDEMVRHFELLSVFFYARLLLSKARVPAPLERWLLRAAFLLRRPLLALFDPDSSSSAVRSSRRMMRRLALKYVR